MSVISKQQQLQQSAATRTGSVAQDFGVIEVILRERAQFLAEISQGINLRSKIRALLISSSAFLAIYGAVLGSTHSLLQAFSAAVKLPLLFLITLFICVPALYIFSVLFGARHRLPQIVAMVLAAITVTSVLLVSLAPVTLFFLLTTSGYQFFKLLNVFFFAIAGVVGMIFLRRGMNQMTKLQEAESSRLRRMVLYIWIILYGFVGSQMAWTLRPFVGRPGTKFEVVREMGGNFYGNILYSLGELLGFITVM